MAKCESMQQLRLQVAAALLRDAVPQSKETALPKQDVFVRAEFLFELNPQKYYEIAPSLWPKGLGKKPVFVRKRYLRSRYTVLRRILIDEGFVITWMPGGKLIYRTTDLTEIRQLNINMERIVEGVVDANENRIRNMKRLFPVAVEGVSHFIKVLPPHSMAGPINDSANEDRASLGGAIDTSCN